MTKGPRRQFEHRRIRSAVIWKKDEKRQCILTILEWVERGGAFLRGPIPGVGVERSCGCHHGGWLLSCL